MTMFIHMESLKFFPRCSFFSDQEILRIIHTANMLFFSTLAASVTLAGVPDALTSLKQVTGFNAGLTKAGMYVYIQPSNLY